MIIVDTSVWVDYFHDRMTPAAEYLEERRGKETYLLGDVILHEVLRGFDDDRKRRDIVAYLTELRIDPMLGADRALRSAARYRALRRRGVTVRKPNDAIIASYCIDEYLPLLSSDRDFRGYVPLGLELVEG